PSSVDPFSRALLGVGSMLDDDEGFVYCPSCQNGFQSPPRGDMAIGGDLTFSHIPKVLKDCLHTICQNCAEDGLQRSK
ncbi:unnamed protein product, partial [Ectocarpus sp. 12 AP-2014]